MREVSPYPLLWSPLPIGPIVVKHRAVMSPHAMGLGDGSGGVSSALREYLLERARGGAAIVALESAAVDRSTASRTLTIRLDRDDIIDGLADLASAIHAHGAHLSATLWHGGRLDGSLQLPSAVAPSAIPSPDGTLPRELSRNEIRALVLSYGSAAYRCAMAGVDLIEVQMASDYLLGSFLSPWLNRRRDEYGGCLVNRVRVIKEILYEVRERVGPRHAVGIRCSASHGVTPAGNGLCLDESLDAVAHLAELALVDYVSVMSGSSTAPQQSVPGMNLPRCTHSAAGKAFRERLGGLPVTLAGRIRTPQEAEEMLRSESADLIAMARSWIADPHWAAKAIEGDVGRIRPCVSCNQGCVGFAVRGAPSSCVFNPVAGRETVLVHGPSSSQRKVAVVGGGPAGMECARLSAERGHRTVLFEKEAVLGGQLRLASRVPGREELGLAIDWWDAELRRLGVEVFLGRMVESVAWLDSDVVIWATGGRSASSAVWRRRPYLLSGIPGTENLPHGRELLRGERVVTGRVLIIDEEGGWPAIGVVYAALTSPGVTEVTVVTPDQGLAYSELHVTHEYPAVTALLQRHGNLRIVAGDFVEDVADGSARLKSRGPIGPFDSMVLVAGTEATIANDDSLAIGDCVAPRGWWSATADAHRLLIANGL
jgi:2,4-dienoyl-CoA reductase-like NADH-dependent reductase (Old Yellow Enzyme family)